MYLFLSLMSCGVMLHATDGDHSLKDAQGFCIRLWCLPCAPNGRNPGLNRVHTPPCSPLPHPFVTALPCQVFPLPMIFLANMVLGLGGTQALSLPMFVVLRRFTILMTLAGEWALLGVQPSRPVMVAVTGLIGGALVAAWNDLAYSFRGYALVMGTNLATALNGVVVKSKLSGDKVCGWRCRSCVNLFDYLFSTHHPPNFWLPAALVPCP